MPIYEYECKRCGAEITRKQRITDEPLESASHDIPSPGKVATCFGPLKRLISRGSFSLQGGGWTGKTYR